MLLERTNGQLIEEFLEWQKERGRKTGTIASQASYLEQIRDFLGDVKLLEASAQEITAYRDYLISCNFRESTVGYHLYTLRTFYQFCLKRGYISDTPIKNVLPEKKYGRRRKRLRAVANA